jgi:hypothetical protein
VKDPYDGHAGLLYEVSLDADAAIAAPFDTWLRDHIADLLALPGFQSAEIFEAPADPDRVRRVVQYRLHDRVTLDNYLQVHAPRLRESGLERFGDRFSVERRVLTHREEFVSGSVSTENCLNCGEVLTGQHCAHCGQRASVRVISLWSMLTDLVGDLVDWDSRVWRTLRPLAFKPGWLTQQFLIGRRAAFTPPFRMYLILSLVFFLVASFDDPGQAIQIGNGAEGTNLTIGGDGPLADKDQSDGAMAPPAADPDRAAENAPPVAGKPAASAAGAGATKSPELDEKTRRAIDAVVKLADPKDQAEVRTKIEQAVAEIPERERAPVAGMIGDPCGKENLKLDVGGIRQYEARLRLACEKVMSDQATFGRALWNNIPKAMFIALPVLAGFMALLYLGSRRYYVEHLVFFVHFHTFFFLAGIVVLLLERLGDLDGNVFARGADTLANAVEFVCVFYLPWYLYRAMRRVYGQGRVWTFAKFLALDVAYLFCFVLTFVGLLFYTALTL